MNLIRGAIDNLLPKLLKLLEDEYKMQTGMKKQVKFISQELEDVNAFLCKVSDVPWYQLDVQTKARAREAREVSYEMEDVLDTFLVRFQAQEPASQTRLRRAMKKMASLFRKGKANHDIGCAIQDIKNRLQHLADRRARYRIDDIIVHPTTTISTVDPRLQAMYKEVANLIGINKPRDDLICKLSARSDDMARLRKIVSIFGGGGLGKTTLAKAVYDKLRQDFQFGAFVPVGRNPNMAKLLMDILYELDKIKYADIHTKKRDERQLIDNLREFLMDKRYFIVIDDIWETKSWEETIQLALLENNRGSRIIITTRNSQVASRISDEVYRMQPLSNCNSKRLFYTRIYGTKEKWPDNETDKISNKILKKCDGVPLAIITMASLLVGKPSERWSDVFNSIGFGNKDNKQVENTMKILSYSYDDMPSHLRTCLLYLSVFPEDYTIDKNSLIWKWIAEGFVQERQGFRLFDLGERYFNDLINRSMVQVVKSQFPCVVSGCRVHDMVLDLIRSISSEENFAIILDNDEGTVIAPSISSARRLAKHNDTLEYTIHINVVNMPQLRSLITYKCSIDKWVLLSSFRHLRVLAMECCKNVWSSHLVHLGKLLHLRYLGLQHTWIDDLPHEIGALKLLQTLNLDNTRIRQLTPSISQLIQLLCLKCKLGPMLAPKWIGKLVSLEELQLSIYFSNDAEKDHARGFFKELGSLRKLRVFWGRVYEMDESMQRDLVMSLRNLHKLQHLELWFDSCIDADIILWGETCFVPPQHLQSLHIGGIKFSCLPACISAMYLPNLTHLTLTVRFMDEKGLEFLGRLPELCSLSLFTDSTLTISDISTSNSGYFKKLRICWMYRSMLQFWCTEGDLSVSFHIWNGIDAMPFGSSENDRSLLPCTVMSNLEVLAIRIFVRALKDGKGHCGNMGLEYLTSLRKIEVFIHCGGAYVAEVDEVESELRRATEVHPNHPMLNMHRRNEDKMISTVQN